MSDGSNDGASDGATISVVIPHLNQPGELARCLAALAANSRAPEEVIVVDNGSAELPEAVCAAHGARLIREPEPGPGPARNAGIAAAQGAIIAFIDADCRADPGWLAAIAAGFADPSAEILGGDVRIDYADPDRITAIEAYESIYSFRMDRYIAHEGYTGGGNLAVRRAVPEAVGPFAGLGTSEDKEWGQRATAAGHDLRYVPEMRVHHPARGSFDELARKWDRHMAHFYMEARRRPGGRAQWALRTLAMPLSPIAEIPRIAMSDRVSGLRARILALACLTRLRLYRARVMAWLMLGGDPQRLTGRWNRAGE